MLHGLRYARESRADKTHAHPCDWLPGLAERCAADYCPVTRAWAERFRRTAPIGGFSPLPRQVVHIASPCIVPALWLDKLHPIPEGIAKLETIIAGGGDRVEDVDAVSLQRAPPALQIIDLVGEMGFGAGPCPVSGMGPYPCRGERLSVALGWIARPIPRERNRPLQ